MRKVFFLLFVIFISKASINNVSAAVAIVPASRIVPVNGDPDPAKVKAAVADFKNLSHHERKMRLKEVKAVIKDYKKEKREGKEPQTSTLLLVLITILLPPLGVYLHEGVINNKFWIDLLLTLLFYVPGLIYGLIVVLGKD